MRIKYLGEPGWIGRRLGAPGGPPGRVIGGKVLAIRLRGKDGKRIEIKAQNPNAGITPADIMDLGPVDPRIARHIAADPRFQVIP